MRLYRLLRKPEPARADFLSNAERGRTPPDNPEDVRLWDGLSFWETVEQCRAVATRLRAQRIYVAVLDIPDDGTFRIEKTRGEGHYTVWGHPDAFLRCVVEVQTLLLQGGTR